MTGGEQAVQPETDMPSRLNIGGYAKLGDVFDLEFALVRGLTTANGNEAQPAYYLSPNYGLSA